MDRDRIWIKLDDGFGTISVYLGKLFSARNCKPVFQALRDSLAEGDFVSILGFTNIMICPDESESEGEHANLEYVYITCTHIKRSTSLNDEINWMVEVMHAQLSQSKAG